MRKQSVTQRQKSDEINISPLIDMVFILLIFFIVTTVFIDERGLESTKPSAAADNDEETDPPIIFVINKNNEILLDGQKIGLGAVGREFRNRNQNKDLGVVISVEQGARAGMTLRVWDAALEAGAQNENISLKQEN
ncbi:MAG: ExbD/TolR family protein [Verrucomicrobiota bacterium]